MLRGLAATETSGVPEWLKDSWREPEPFYRALHAHVGDTSPAPLKSRPFEDQDLYHDLVVRHLKEGRDAFIAHAAGAGWHRLSYEELHTRTTALAAAWEAAGVLAGQTVAIVLPVSEEYVVALLTALRLGAVVSVLPPRGASFVRRRLKELAPEQVVSHPRYAALLGERARGLLPTSPSADPPTGWLARSHTYAPGDTVARLFSPLSPTPEKPVELKAAALGLGLLRDAVLVLGLRPGDRVALPGFEPLQYQPHALLVTLLAGGCFLEVEARALTDEAVQKLLAPTVVGISPDLRTLLLAGEVSPERWRLWLRNVAEPYDWDRWEQFGAVMATHRRCQGMNLVTNAAFGGSLLFSPAQPKPGSFSVLPTPGQPWRLADLLGTGQPSHGESGLYAATGEGLDEATFGRFLLSHTRTGYFFAGTPRLGSRGQTYPEREVLEVVEAHPDVLGATVVITPGGAPLLHSSLVKLLVFIDPAGEPSSLVGVLEPELKRRIDVELGERYRPDTLHYYPLSPRRTDQGGIDRDWCRWQFLSGTLDRKAGHELFRMLGHLRQLLTRVHEP